jgi:hypothetical protein
MSLSDLTGDPNTGRRVAALDQLDDTLAYARTGEIVNPLLHGPVAAFSRVVGDTSENPGSGTRPEA